MHLSIHEALHPTSQRGSTSADDMLHRLRMPFWDHAYDDLATVGRDAPALQVGHDIVGRRTSRKLFLDFQDMYRLHGAPLLLPSCCRTGSLRPVIGPTVSKAGRYSRDYYGASALLCPVT
jgi:hypothetical protein